MPTDYFEERKKRDVRAENRSESSPKRESDRAPSKWPLVTSEAYKAVLRAGVNSKEVDSRSKGHLCLGRIRIGQAVLAVDAAMQSWNPQVPKNPVDRKVYNALRSVGKKLGDALAQYPLEIK